MRHSEHYLRVEGDEPEQKPRSPEEIVLDEARKRWREFFGIHKRTIGAYLGTTGIPFTVEPGGWFVNLDPKNIRINADPEFFIQRGYSESESIFATFHEAEHFRDMVRDPESYEDLFDRIESIDGPHPAYNQALQRLYNCLDDVLVNRMVMSRWKAGVRARETLYHKLFPNTNFVGQPRHRQLMYAILREAMLPSEPCQVDPEVREAIDAWQKRGGSHRAIDVLTAVKPDGSAVYEGDARFTRIKQTLEPVFRALYEKDLQDRQPTEEQKTSDKGKNPKNGKPQSGNPDPFGDDPNQDAIPDPVDMKDAAEKVSAVNKALSKKRAADFEGVMGVSEKDFENYKHEQERVNPHIQALAEVFKKVIQRRKEIRRVLRGVAVEGPMLDPSQLARVVAEMDTGNSEVRAMRKVVKKEVVRNRPNQLEFTLVCDGSGSMNESRKKTAQRLFAILAMEGFAKFRSEVERERRGGQNINLEISSGLRVFGDTDEVVKPLSKTLEHKDRVRFRKRLAEDLGQGNNEPKTFEAIERDEFTPQKIEAMRRGDLKKIIVFLTDGESDSVAIQACIKHLMDLARDPHTGECNLVIAGIGFEDGQSAKDTYAPNGYFAKDLGEMPQIFVSLITNILDDV